MMKIVRFFAIFALASLFFACDNDNNGEDEFAVIRTPGLGYSSISDRSVTLQWGGYTASEYQLNTKCLVLPTVEPERYEIYQSSNPETGFELVATYKNNKETNFLHKVSNLTNGKPVYFYLQTFRKGYEPGLSPTVMFVPNPEPNKELIVNIPDSQREIALSPTLDKVAYMSFKDGAEGNICILTLNTGEKEEINIVPTQYPSWSSDGKEIVCSSTGYHASQILLYDCETKAIQTLTSGENRNAYPVFSPDNKKILYEFVNYTMGASQIRMLDLSAEEIEEKVVLNGMNHNIQNVVQPAWIDNEQFLFTGLSEGYQYYSAIYIASIKDDTVKPLVGSDKTSDYMPRISPDKKRVLLISNRSGIYQLWLYDIANETYRQLTGYNMTYGKDHLMPYTIGWIDDATIYYSTDSQNLYRLHL